VAQQSVLNFLRGDRAVLFPVDHVQILVLDLMRIPDENLMTFIAGLDQLAIWRKVSRQHWAAMPPKCDDWFGGRRVPEKYFAVLACRDNLAFVRRPAG